MEMGSMLQKMIAEEMAAMETSIRVAIQSQLGQAIGVAPAAEAPSAQTTGQPGNVEAWIANLEGAIMSSGFSWTVQNPQQAYVVLTQLISVLKNLIERIKGLERQNTEWEVLVSELKKRATGTAPEEKKKTA